MNTRILKLLCLFLILLTVLQVGIWHHRRRSPSAQGPPISGSLIEQWRSELAQQSETAKVADRQIAARAAAEASKPAQVLKLVFLMARDAIFDTTNAEIYLGDLLQPSFTQFSNEESEYLDGFLVRASDELRIRPFVAEPYKSDVKDPLRHLGLSAAGTGLLAGTDLAVVSRTSLFTKWTGKILGKVGKPLSGKVAILAGSGTAAVSDGFLPVGDMLAAVGLAWTAYDLHDTRARFESELSDALSETFSDIREEVHAEILQSVVTEGEPP